MDAPTISVIVPTLNEADNLPELLRRLAAALRARVWEIIVVDDGSTDGTLEVCGKLSEFYPVRLLVRRRPADGLSGAVVQGLSAADGQLLAVMDADLQHPPESVPALLSPLERGEADFVIGSRHVHGAAVAGQWPALRRLNSWAATLLAWPIAGAVRDPMSGFFALHRVLFERARGLLNPTGYKIALELLCKCRPRRVVEVPIHFAARHAGHSKLGLREQLRYLRHLLRLYAFVLGAPAAAMPDRGAPRTQQLRRAA